MDVVGARWRRLGRSRRERLKRAGAYLFGAVVTTYAVINLTYDLNIDLFASVTLPLSDFYRDQVVPFLLSPLVWVGLDFSPWYGSILAISGVGASVWTGAEFRGNSYLILHPFPNRQMRAGVPKLPKTPEEWETATHGPPPTRLLSRRSLIRFPYTVVLQYSLLGLVGFVAGAAVGLRRLARALRQVGLFLLGTLVYMLQLSLARFERWGDDEHVPTRIFLWAYNYRQSLDKKLEEATRRNQVIPVTELGSMKPLARGILDEAARLSALVFVLLATLLLLVAWRTGHVLA